MAVVDYRVKFIDRVIKQSQLPAVCTIFETVKQCLRYSRRSTSAGEEHADVKSAVLNASFSTQT